MLQWFVILFTGQRNEGLCGFQRAWIGCASPVYGYEYLLYDSWPAFGTDWGQRARRVRAQTVPGAGGPAWRPASLRIISVIPALIILMVLSIAIFCVMAVAWFAIVITGRLSRGVYDFILLAPAGCRSRALSAYTLLMTDDYPRYAGAEPTSTLPPGDLDRGGHGPAVDPGTPPTQLPPPSGPPAG